MLFVKICNSINLDPQMMSPNGTLEYYQLSFYSNNGNQIIIHIFNVKQDTIHVKRISRFSITEYYFKGLLSRIFLYNFTETFEKVSAGFY